MNVVYYDLDKPVEKVIIKNMIKFSIDNTTITPFIKANITTLLYDNIGNIVEVKNFIMSGEDYNNWNGSDEYLINWIKVQIDLMYNNNI